MRSFAAGKESYGCCNGYIWIAGYRSGLSGTACKMSFGGQYPYFNTTQGADPEYQGCGQHPVTDWVWRITDRDLQTINLPWSEYGNPENHWFSKKNVGEAVSNPQPTGWSGPFSVRPWPDGGMYENCTATKFLSDQDESSELLPPSAVNKTWYNDFDCEAPLDRWVRPVFFVSANMTVVHPETDSFVFVQQTTLTRCLTRTYPKKYRFNSKNKALHIARHLYA